MDSVFMFLLDLLSRFCEHSLLMKGYTKATLSRYRSNVRLFSKRTGINTIESVTKNVIKSFFLDGRSRYAWSAATFITYYKTLKVFFRWCRKENYLAEDLLEDIEKPKLEKKIPLRLNQHDAMRLLEVVYNYPYDYPYLRYRNHAIFATFIFAGLRKKELLNLKYADVDFENRSIFVRQGKGNKDRIIPMCARLAEILERYVSERHRLKKCCPEFFASLNHNQGLTEDGWRHLLELAVDAFGVKFSAHKLRHTFATLMLEGGCDIYSLSKMMGHSDISTTTIYLTASAEHLRGQMLKHPLNT